MDTLCNVMGRRQVVRAAAFMLRRSRLDLPNQLHINGERSLQRWLLEAYPATAPLTVLDVGAHVGTWSRSVLQLADELGHRVDLHAFEPAPDTHRLLRANLPDVVRVNHLAVSDQPGELDLHVVAPTAGTNSLHSCGDVAQVSRTTATTIDAYAKSRRVSRIHLLKVDAEGHDFRVLCGATQLLGQHAVEAIQFEYNHRWVHARHFLKDVFDLFGPLSYGLGKLTPRGVEWYPGWDPDLETFVEGNYVACTQPLVQRLPGIRWWKESS